MQTELTLDKEQVQTLKVYQVLNKGDKVKFISNNGEWSKLSLITKQVIFIVII